MMDVPQEMSSCTVRSIEGDEYLEDRKYRQ